LLVSWFSSRRFASGLTQRLRSSINLKYFWFILPSLMADEEFIRNRLLTLKNFGICVNDIDSNSNLYHAIKTHIKYLLKEGEKNNCKGICAIEYFNKLYLYEEPNGKIIPYLTEEILASIKIYIDKIEKS
jgi:hypothetical protein